MELHKSLKHDDLYVEYTRAYSKVEKEYKDKLKLYNKNYTIIFLLLIIILPIVQQSLFSLSFTLPVFILGFFIIFFLNKITFILHVQDIKLGESLREVVNIRFVEEGRKPSYKDFKENVKKLKEHYATQEKLQKELEDIKKNQPDLWEKIIKNKKNP